MGSGVVGLVMKGMLSEGELFNTSGNLPVLWELGKAVLPGSAGPQKYMVNTIPLIVNVVEYLFICLLAIMGAVSAQIL